jgi:multidrug resistance efflux pump
MRVPFRVRLQRLLRAGILLVLFALIPVFLWQQTQSAAAYRSPGVVEGEAETVGAVQPARILSIEVQLGQRVKPGDVLVRLDPADRTLDVAMQEARLADFEQSLLRYEQDVARYKQTLQESERRCNQAVQESAVELETAKMNCAAGVAELAGLQAEIKRLQPLIEKRLVSELELSSLRPKAQALEQTVARYIPLIEILQKRYDLAVKDQQEVRALLASLDAPSAADPLKASMRQVAQTCRQAAKAEPFVLRASRTGVVSRVQRQTGDVVVAGEPIVRVASTCPLYIIGMLTQRQLTGLAVGDKLEVIRKTAGGQQTFKAEVETLEAEVMDLLDPFNPAPRFPVRGRRVRLRLLDASGSLVPGEAVTLQPAHAESWLESVKRISFFSASRASSL